MSAQPGIFALGTSDHCYLEFGWDEPSRTVDFVRAGAALVTELSTVGGVNVVLGIRPELWAGIADDDEAVPGVAGWDDDLVGPDGFTMPATQQDGWLWISGGSRAAVFDAGRHALSVLRPIAELRGEVGGWLYRHSRDLTGFVDGTENPSLIEAPAVVATAHGAGAGNSVVLYQLWRHHTAEWQAAGEREQERVMGRTKADSVELPEDELPPDSHVARTVLEVDGQELPIFRRNVAYGDVREHGTVFVGFSADQWRLTTMLRRMAGIEDGIRCALTRYTTPVSGAYYVVPSTDALARFSPQD